MKLTKKCWIAASALAMVTLAGQAAWAGDNYYRWYDDSGAPVNSDRPPPPGVDYEVISKRDNRVNLEEPDEPQAASTSTPSQGAVGEAAASPQVERDPEICATAQANLETLNTHARIRVPDGEGSFRYIGEEEKATQRANAEQLIAQHCE